MASPPSALGRATAAATDRPADRARPAARVGRSAAPFELRDLPLDGEGPLYDQIYRALADAILAERVSAGTRLPTSRALAAELGVSRNTVVTAFEALRAEGYVVSRVGAGTFVAPQIGSHAPRDGSRQVAAASTVRDRSASVRADGDRVPSTRPPRPRLSRWGQSIASTSPRRLHDRLDASPPLAYDFRPCVPDLARLDYEDWRRALVRTAHHAPDSLFDYGDPAGLPALREAIARYLARARGVVCDPSEVVVVGGVAQALDLVGRLLVDPGDSVLIEHPHYLGARRSFLTAGARLVGAPVDEQGVDPSRVDPASLSACRLAYVTPSHQFPTGTILSLARRQQLLAWATGANAFILEDDYDSEFRYSGRAIPALKSLDDGDRVLYVGTFSKTLLPGLRIAYIVAPASLAALIRSAKWLSDWSAPVFEQAALADYLDRGYFERHLRRARTLYAARRDALVDAIETRLARFGPRYHDSRAGLHLLLRFPTLAPQLAARLVEAGRRVGLGLYPAAPCYASEARVTRDAVAAHARGIPLGAPSETQLVMGFARLDPEAIDRGIQELARLIESLAPTGSHPGRIATT